MAEFIHEPILYLFRQRLLEALPRQIQRVVLFGSRARGDATSDSDLDLLIVVDDDLPAVTERIRQIRYAVMEEHNFSPLLSLVILNQKQATQLEALGSGFIDTLEREGIALWPA